MAKLMRPPLFLTISHRGMTIVVREDRSKDLSYGVTIPHKLNTSWSPTVTAAIQRALWAVDDILEGKDPEWPDTDEIHCYC